MLNVVNVSKFYGARKALDGVSFTVARRETIAVLGMDGAGKSTLLRILAGYQSPTNGSVAVEGNDPKKAQTRNNIGYLPQNAPMPPLMRAGEYLRFRAEIKGLAGKRYINKAITEVSGFCPIDSLKHTMIKTLTRSQRQWLGLADALLGSPELLILDEPIEGMSAEDAAHVWELVTELTGRGTFIVGCRNVADCRQFCKRAVILDGGQVVADGDPDAIFMEYVEDRTVAVSIVANEPVREAFRAVPGVKTVSVTPGLGPEETTIVRVVMPAGLDLRQELSQLCAQRGWIITAMHREPVQLEDVFRNLRQQ